MVLLTRVLETDELASLLIQEDIRTCLLMALSIGQNTVGWKGKATPVKRR